MALYYNVPDGTTILEVCLDRKVDIEIPRFCYHELLSFIAGNCRMCLVEVKGRPENLSFMCRLLYPRGWKY
jgi:NADH dehydrogenase/NADH:ubiquinone oxidoreductase subunit G